MKQVKIIFGSLKIGYQCMATSFTINTACVNEILWFLWVFTYYHCQFIFVAVSELSEIHINEVACINAALIWYWYRLNLILNYNQSDTKPNLLAKILATKFGFVPDLKLYSINSSSPSAAYMRQWTGSAVVQVTTWCLFGAKPLPASLLTFCQLYP